MAHPRSRRLLIVLMLLASFLTAVRLAWGQGDDTEVVGNGTPESCTEEALDEALQGGGTITFDCGGAHTITVTSQKVIRDETTIGGDGQITLDGGDAVRVFKVEADASLTLNQLTLANGYADDWGGAIYSEGALTLNDTTIRDSAADPDLRGSGGGIYSFGGLLVLKNSRLLNNAAVDGGGLTSADDEEGSRAGSLTMIDSLVQGNSALLHSGGLEITNPATLINTTVRDNEVLTGGDRPFFGKGGGISMYGNTLTIQNSVIENNRAYDGGGGLYLENAATVVVEDSRVSGNATTAEPQVNLIYGGGINNNYGSLTLSRVTVSGNSASEAAGLFNLGMLLITNSTFNDNTADFGAGGLYLSDGSVRIVNSTVSGNSAGQYGGGVVAGTGTMDLQNVTLWGNSAPAGANYHPEAGETGTVVLQNTIVGNPQGGGENCVLATNPPASGGYNLSSDESCGLDGTGDQEGTDPQLEPLADNGGGTDDPVGRLLTHMPQEGSPAIDAVEGDCPDADQRGYTRPAGPACDIGAVERGAEIPTPTATATETTEPTATGTATIEPSPTATATPIPPDAPAPTLVPADLPDGVRPTINVDPANGYVGQSFTASGQVEPGYGRVRISVVVEGETIGALYAPVDENGTYSEQVPVGAQLAPGVVQVCAAVEGTGEAEHACTDFRVDPAPLSVVQGTLPIQAGSPVNATLRLMSPAGQTLYSAPIAPNGSFRIANVRPGLYQFSVAGQLLNPVSPGVSVVPPGRTIDLGMIVYDRCNTITGQLQAATTSVEASPSRQALQTRLSAGGVPTRQQIRPFGLYVTGVFNEVTFTAAPQTTGRPEKVIFEFDDPSGRLVQRLEAPGPSFSTRFNVGRLPPSFSGRHSKVWVTPVVNGQRQCPSVFDIEVMPNPLDPRSNEFLQPGTRLWADGGIYRFDAFVPYIEGVLPAIYDTPDLPLLGVLRNRFNAAIRAEGWFNLDGIGRVDRLSALVLAEVLSYDVLNEIETFEPPRHELNMFAFRELGIPISKDLAREEWKIPWKVPVFSFFGIVNVNLVGGVGAAVGTGIDAVVKPLRPAVRVTLYGYGDVFADIGLSVDLLLGLAEAGLTMRGGVRVDVPLVVELNDQGADGYFDDPCLQIYIAGRLFASAFWGLIETEYISTIANFKLAGCDSVAGMGNLSPGPSPTRGGEMAPASLPPLSASPPSLVGKGAEGLGSLTPTQAITEEVPAPELIAAPDVAIAPYGRTLSAYVENTAADGETPRVQVIARFKNLDTGEWEPAVAISDPAHSARSPVVGFVGPNATPLVAWVENTLTAEEAEALGDDINAHARRQELFYSLWDGENWGAPIQLTDNLLAEGLPAMEGSPSGSVLAWTRDLDGDLATREDTRIAVALYEPESGGFGPVELLSGGEGGLNADLDVAYDLNGETPVPYIVWVHDADANLLTGDDRRIAVAYRRDFDWVTLNPQPLPPRVDSPAITVGAEGVQVAFLVREPDPESDVTPLGINGILWTARLQEDGSWSTQQVLDDGGEAVYAERPVLESYQEETLLLFRQFGEAGTNAELGQISLSRMVAEEAASPPLYLTDQPNQNWYQAMAINPLDGRAEILKVAATYAYARGAAGGRTSEVFDGQASEVSDAQTSEVSEDFGSLEARTISAWQAVPATGSATLSAAEDPVDGLTVEAGADPALDPLRVAPTAPAPGERVTVEATIRNVGRGTAREMTLRLYKGTPGNGTLLREANVPGTLDFNQTRTVTLRVAGEAGEYELYAEVSTGDENLSAANDRASVTLGRLSAPGAGTIGENQLYEQALELVWSPVAGEYVAGYRILRSTAPDGTYELVGESSVTGFVDTLVEREQQYCYKVQAYNEGGAFSPESEAWCGSLGAVPPPTGIGLYLPLVIR